MSPEDFHDHNKWQDLHYRKPTGRQFKQTHVFTIKHTGGEGGGSRPTVLLKQDDKDADVRYIKYRIVVGMFWTRN